METGPRKEGESSQCESVNRETETGTAEALSRDLGERVLNEAGVGLNDAESEKHVCQRQIVHFLLSHLMFPVGYPLFIVHIFRIFFPFKVPLIQLIYQS